MAFGIYLMVALLVVACTPLLYVIGNWYYLRFAKGIPAFGLTIPWARSAPPDRHMPEATHTGQLLVNEEVRARLEPNWTRPGLSGIPKEMQARMKELAIGFDGRQYTFSGYRYDRLSDAINYAELIRSRSALHGQRRSSGA